VLGFAAPVFLRQFLRKPALPTIGEN
jgi:hypothetical protein